MLFDYRAKLCRQSYYAVLCLLVVILLFIPINGASTSVLASATFALGKTLVSDEFTVNYPDRFTAKAISNTITIASSEAVMNQRVGTDLKLASGSVHIQVNYMMFGTPSDFGLSAQDTAHVVHNFGLNASMHLDAVEPFKAGAIEGSRAVRHEKDFDGIVASFFVSKALFVACLSTAPKETVQYEGLFNGVIQSIRANLTSEPTSLILPYDLVKLNQSSMSKDGKLQFDYPDGWIARDSDDTAGQVNLANSEAALEAIKQTIVTDMASGQIGIQLYFGDVVHSVLNGVDVTSENLMSQLVNVQREQVDHIQSFRLGLNHATRAEIDGAHMRAVFIGVVDGNIPILAGIYTAPKEADNAETILQAVVLSALKYGQREFIAMLTKPPETASSDNPDLPQTFVSSDKSLRFNYPAGWVTRANQPGQVMLANSDKALADISKSTLEYLPPGEAGIDFVYFSVEQAPSNLDVSGDPEKSLQGLVKQLVSEPKYTFEDIKTHQLGAYSVASMVMKTKGTNANIILYIFFVDRIVVVVGGVCTPNEVARLEATIEALILSLRIKV